MWEGGKQEVLSVFVGEVHIVEVVRMMMKGEIAINHIFFWRIYDTAFCKGKQDKMVNSKNEENRTSSFMPKRLIYQKMQ